MSNEIIRKNVTWGELPLYRKVLRLVSFTCAFGFVAIGGLFVFPLASRFPDAAHTIPYHFKGAVMYQTDAQSTLYWWAWYAMIAVFTVGIVCGVIEEGFKEAWFKERKKAFWNKVSDEQNKKAQ